MKNSKFARFLSEDTTSSDIAQVDNKLGSSSKIIRRVICEKCKNEIVEDIETFELTEAEIIKVEDLLRDSGIKIKTIIKTKFGSQIDLYQDPKDSKDVKSILKNYKYQLKDKSLFVYN